MPDAVVAVIELEDGRVGILPFPEAYRVHIEYALKNSDKLKPLSKFQTIDFPGLHTIILPQKISSLDGLVCEETRDIKVGSDEYKLYVYNTNYTNMYEQIKELSQKN